MLYNMSTEDESLIVFSITDYVHYGHLVNVYICRSISFESS